MIHQLKTEQFLKADIDKVWEFVSSPKNLKKITPPYMGFDITSDKILHSLLHIDQSIVVDIVQHNSLHIVLYTHQQSSFDTVLSIVVDIEQHSS